MRTSFTFAQIGINTNTTQASAMLDIYSTTKGLLTPRMNNAAMSAITSPADGLIVHCLDCDPKGLYLFSEGNWKNVSSIIDATTALKGKIQLAGDLTGAATSPYIGSEKITSDKVASKTIDATKIDAGLGQANRILTVDASEIVNWAPAPFTASYTVVGPTNVEIRGNCDTTNDSPELPYYTDTVTLTKGMYLFVNKNNVYHYPKTVATDGEATTVWIELYTDSGLAITHGTAQIPKATVYEFALGGQAFFFEVLSTTAVVKFRFRPTHQDKAQCNFKIQTPFSGIIYNVNGAYSTSSVTGFNLSIDSSLCALEGSYTRNTNLINNLHKYKVTITNTGSNSIGTITLSPSNVSLSGVAGLSVVGVSPQSFTLASGASQTIEYQLSGTPTSSGTLTAQWNLSDLTCTKTAQVNEEIYKRFIASYAFTSPVLNEQGIMDNTEANKVVIDILFTGATVGASYPSFTSTPIAISAGEGGDVNNISYSYPAGTYTSTTGTIPVTLIIDGDGSYNVIKQTVVNGEALIGSIPIVVNSVNSTIQLIATGGIRDVMYDKLDNNGNLSHQMVYFPITTSDGKTWLNNNLGANYANINKTGIYAPLQQATNVSDYNAYGSIFQGVRKPDGHELVNWSSGTAASVTSTTSSQTAYPAEPNHANYIVVNGSWQPYALNLWDGTNTRNPCPCGYRVPTTAEYTALFAAHSITNSSTGFSSPLKFSNTGYRSLFGGLNSPSSEGDYWTATNYGGYLGNIILDSGGVLYDNSPTAYGYSIRCIKK